ncbi:L-threonylcarbamoyladenylate synthase [Methanosalsum natronophilum]|uniref:L-threonylcarbamoyladenylate synthase n=1 Tax=Methanosalsum natronophilum TaxID=768733 RepID=UPI002169B612|nr:L-threonylcarbamoyladenylate synthase [Methanosalsum natronophilum]MCS3924661.1 L-threonylcarbamoyladenylate synthase [Methanosalsum natronophilum]
MYKTSTQLLKLNNKNFNRYIEYASSVVYNGGTVAFPTETVYGLGANALEHSAVSKIFEAKGRPADNPLIVHISSKEDISKIALEIPDQAHKLIDLFWPGPLTLIMKRKRIVPDITTGGLDTVAIRMPANKIAISLLKNSGCPIAAPSANLSGKPSPTTAQHVLKDLNGKIDIIIDGGDVTIGLESTVLDLTSSYPTILRPGDISYNDLCAHLDRVEVGYNNNAEESKIVKSPGLKYKHYSPKSHVILALLTSTIEKHAEKIVQLQKENKEKKKKVGLLLMEETSQHIKSYYHLNNSFSLGKNAIDAGKALFRGLRYFDDNNFDIIIVDGNINNEGIGVAVLNRLRKAADEIL